MLVNTETSLQLFFFFFNIKCLLCLSLMWLPGQYIAPSSFYLPYYLQLIQCNLKLVLDFWTATPIHSFPSMSDPLEMSFSAQTEHTVPMLDLPLWFSSSITHCSFKCSLIFLVFPILIPDKLTEQRSWMWRPYTQTLFFLLILKWLGLASIMPPRETPFRYRLSIYHLFSNPIYLGLIKDSMAVPSDITGFIKTSDVSLIIFCA